MADAAPPPEPSAPRPRILFVDDVKLAHRMVSLMLAPVADVVCLSTLASGREAFLNQGPFQLVITDLAFPEGDAWPFVFLIRQRSAPLELPIIMLTSSSDKVTVAKAYQCGVNLVVRKPPQPPEFQRAVMAMLATPTVHPPEDPTLCEAHIVTWVTPSRAVAFCPNLDLREEGETTELAVKALRTRIAAAAANRQPIPLVAGIVTTTFLPRVEV